MKNLIVSMNSKFIHSSLGAWYLKAAANAKGMEVKVLQCTINDSLERILANIYKERPDTIAFSSYIWNINEVYWLCENIKKLIPNITIILGGPEVSFDTEEVLINNPTVDYIIRGEGEEVYPKLLQAITENKEVSNLDSVCYWGKAGAPKYAVVEDLNSLPTPYSIEMLEENKGKIIYFEASRGCPFNCAYCLSSTFDGVRYFSMNIVKEELRKIVSYGVKQVKFVDRTFNANKVRAKEILRFIIKEFSNLDNINFHFEVAADLFDDEMIMIVDSIPKGLVQFEIGVQTTNEEVLDEVNRKTNTEKVLNTIKRLIESGRVHVHADLIAGLPKEDKISFIKSFEDLYNTCPHQLQLGFLKLLKGSGIKLKCKEYGYVFKNTPPYEVLYNNVMSFDDVLELKVVEEMVERLYNSGRYKKSLDYIIEYFEIGPYEFFRCFGIWFESRGFFDRGISNRELYILLLEFSQNISNINIDLLEQMLIFDFLSVDNTGNIPRGLSYEIQQDFRDKCFGFLKKTDNVGKYFPHFTDKSAKEIYKQIYFFKFKYDFTLNKCFENKECVVIFDYSRRDRVTDLYYYFNVLL